MIVEYLHSPIYMDSAGDNIDCVIKFDHFNEELPFTASKNDTLEHGRQIYDALIAGKFGPIAEYVPKIEQETSVTTTVKMPVVITTEQKGPTIVA